ncbi:MAG: hypothetical protein KKC68_06905 [Candidatus Thermoplasmatota archaeon]|nr:hypothetical protein [Candidatus Thermoplasmatota archaeon]MBU1941489.1 hypothetical protein [Candidatus Thermoplasmatota archaeon]
MEKKYMERLVGKYCKIVTKEPGEQRASVVTGTLEDVDYKDGFILVDSSQGLGCLRINTIIAIKPGRRTPQHKTHQDKQKLTCDEQAMVGIGTLIVFIAMVLIAAVAASVLITTSESLQQRAKAVGIDTIREISAGLVIEDVVGYTDVNRSVVEYLAIEVRSRAGAADMDLTTVTLSILYDEFHLLKYNGSIVENANTDDASVFETPIDAGSNITILAAASVISYGIIAMFDADGSITTTDGLGTGDRIYMIVNLTALINDTGGLPPRSSISGKVQPELGSPGLFELSAPAVLTSRIIDLW